MEKTNPDTCNHKEWLIITPSKGDGSGISECKTCGLWLTHAERLNWESLKSQKLISKLSIALSIVAIIVSVFSLISNAHGDSQSLLTLKVKCQQDGGAFIQKIFTTPNGSGVSPYNQFFAYSPELNTCLADVRQINNTDSFTQVIYDIYSGKQLAAYTENVGTQKVTGGDYVNFTALENKYFSTNAK